MMPMKTLRSLALALLAVPCLAQAAWTYKTCGADACDIPERLAMAQQARGESQMANQAKSMEIMDVNAGAVEQAFRDHGVKLMVHGHTHRPARHVLEVDGAKRERWVLPDWDCDHVSPPRGGWLVIDRDGLEFYDLETAD